MSCGELPKWRAGAKNTAEGGVQYQAKTTRYDYTKSFADQLIDFQNSSFPIRDTLTLGRTPDVLKRIGLIGLPMVINQRHVSDALNGTYKGTQQEKLDHTFAVGELATLPEKLADPIAIIYDKRAGKDNPSESNIDVIVEMKVASGKNVIAAVQIGGNGHINGLRIDSNKVSTVHGNTDTVNRLVDAINENQKGNVAVFYLNNKKTTKALQSAGNPIPRGLSNLDGFIHSITDPGSPVKVRISSVTESQQFKRWFGDWQNHPEKASKVVNSDGSPKVMYHGSPAQFTIFDKKKARSSGLYGRGFYFTDSQSHAGTYGQQYSVYLNIKNPLKHGNTAVSRAQVRKFLESVAENEDYSIENYSTYDVDDVLEMVMGSDPNVDAFKLIQDINATAIGDMVEATELFNQVNGTKFDGIVVDTETVAFYPNQIKSATDNIGTFDGSNLDIRYQRRTATLSNRMILEKAAQSVDGQKLTPGQRSALNIFQSHLDELRKLEDKKAEQQKIIQEARAKGAKPVDYQAAVNRRNILSSQIRRETAKLLELENTAVLRRVLEQSKKVIVDEQTAERSWVLTMLGLLQICAFLVLVVTAEFVQK